MMRWRLALLPIVVLGSGACDDAPGTESDGTTEGTTAASTTSPSSTGPGMTGMTGVATGADTTAGTTQGSVTDTSSMTVGPGTTGGTTGDSSGTTGGPTTTGGSSSSSGGGDPCGNGVIDPGEQCDGMNLAGLDCMILGFPAGGVLACDPVMCTLDTSGCMMGPGCGNGVVEPGEQCDGMDLQGFDCASLGLGGGVLACDPVLCVFDTSMCMPGGGTGF